MDNKTINLSKRLVSWAWLLILTVIWIIKIFRSNHRPRDWWVSTSGIISICGIVVHFIASISCGWVLNLRHTVEKDHLRVIAKRIFGCLGTLGLGLFLISSVVDSSCYDDIFWQCNSDGDTFKRMDMPVKVLFLTLISPLFTEPLSSSNTIYVFSSWFLSFACVTIATILFGEVSSWPVPVFSVFVGLIIYDTKINILAKNRPTKILDISATDDTSMKLQAQTFLLKKILFNVSHDLLTPIQALEMGVETLLSIVTDPLDSPNGFEVGISASSHEVTKPSFVRHDKETVDLIESMRGTLSLMSMTIHRCTDAFRADDSGTLTPVLEFFDFQASVIKICHYMRNMQSRIGIDILHMKGMKQKKIYSDKRWFEDNLLCMLSNALKFSAFVEGTNVVVKLFTWQGQDELGEFIDMLTVEVIDTGHNIAESQRSKLFDKPNALKRDDLGGAGLGLWCMSQRASSLGGAVGSRARSDGVCTGSEFWFSIPVAKPPSYGGKTMKRKLAKERTERGPVSLASKNDCDDKSSPGSSTRTMRGILLDGLVSFHGTSKHRDGKTLVRKGSFNSMRMDDDVGSVSDSNDDSLRQRIPGVQTRNRRSRDDSISYIRLPWLVGSGDKSDKNDDEEVDGGLGGEEDDDDDDEKCGDEPRDVETALPVRIVRRALHLPLPTPLVTFSTIPDNATDGIDSEKSLGNISPNQIVGGERKWAHENRPALHVLAVDDSISIMKILRMRLERAGHSVEQASNGLVALETMKLRSFDVILMDLQMPVMDGFTAVKLYRQFKRERRNHDEVPPLTSLVPPSTSLGAIGYPLDPGKENTQSWSQPAFIIGTSANNDAETRLEALSSGMNAFLPKPFSLEAMMEIVEESKAVSTTESKYLLDVTMHQNSRSSVGVGENTNLVLQLVQPRVSDPVSARPEHVPDLQILPETGAELGSKMAKKAESGSKMNKFGPHSGAELKNANTTTASTVGAAGWGDNEKVLEESIDTIQIPPALQSHHSSGASTPYSSVMISTDAPAAHIPIIRALEILVVDDAMPILKIMKLNLKRAGHNVDQAINGAVGLHKMKARPYDVVLMDIQMPTMGGFEATELFREFENQTLKELKIEKQRADQPQPQSSPADPIAAGKRGSTYVRRVRQLIIGMSANKGEGIEGSALKCGMDGFLPKPFNVDLMHQTMQLHLEKFAVNAGLHRNYRVRDKSGMNTSDGRRDDKGTGKSGGRSSGTTTVAAADSAGGVSAGVAGGKVEGEVVATAACGDIVVNSAHSSMASSFSSSVGFPGSGGSSIISSSSFGLVVDSSFGSYGSNGSGAAAAASPKSSYSLSGPHASMGAGVGPIIGAGDPATYSLREAVPGRTTKNTSSV